MSQGNGAGGSRRGGAWGRLVSAMFSSNPVNKGMSGQAASTRRFPQIDNPLLVGAAGLGALAVGATVRTLRPGRRGGRAERFRVLLARAALRGNQGPDSLLAPDDIAVEVHEAFGKPILVSVDVRLRAERVVAVLGLQGEGAGLGAGPDGGPLESAARAAHGVDRARDLVPRATLVDLLTRIVEAAWDNPEIAPVAVRGRVLLVPESGAGRGRTAMRAEAGTTGAHADGEAIDARTPLVIVGMEDLGFVDETARPSDLFDKFGAPDSDPSWRP